MEVTGVLHVHSTHSYDGKLSLPELKVFLQARGISFACMSEHTDYLTPESAAAFVAECRTCSDETFVFVPGFEVPYQAAHILMFGCDEFVSAKADVNQLRSWSFNAALTVLAHPVRNRFEVDDDLLSVLDGVEIWNQQYEGKWLPRSRSARLLQQLRTSHSQLFATGGLDFHRAEHFASPLITVTIQSLSEGAIMEALDLGNFSFGTESLQIEADGVWRPTWAEWLLSQVNIFIIDSGKLVNRILASLGLSLPQSLKRMIRTRV